MLESWVLFLVSVAYVGVLFGIASYGDRMAAEGRAPLRKPWTYSLALGVYCTSWTFYGAVGRAASSGWDFLPIYLGPALVFVFGPRLIGRIVEISKRHNITSIADFIGARYGRHQKLSMLVTLIAVFGVLPYIALQLKAIDFSFEVLAGPAQHGLAQDNALIMAALLAVFSILFGTRQVIASENHHGMVLAIAFESLCKLLAFLAVGLFVVYRVFDGPGEAYRSALALPQVSQSMLQSQWQAGFLTQTLLAAAAILCLPRQFHVTVVENTAKTDLRTARWVFPLYLALISLFVLPIAAAGLTHLPAGSSADTFVLALPLALDQDALALIAYLGGFSAATSMVIVASIALSTMVCNEIVMPALFRWPRLGLAQRQDLSGPIKLIRRIAIACIVALAYLYYRLFTGPGTLTSIGLLSFSAVLHFAPALIVGVMWKRATYRGALWGLVAGFSVWCYTLLLPTLMLDPATRADLLLHGPLHIEFLRPQALFGVDGLDAITHGSLWSLAVNLLFFVGGSLLSAHGLRERLLVQRFLEDERADLPAPNANARPSATVGDLQALMERFFGAERAADLIVEYADERGLKRPPAEQRATPEFARHVERLLAGALGTSSARLVLASTLRGRDMQLEDVVRLLDDTSHAIQFSQERLRATLEHLSQGVSVVDHELRLVAWNQRYVEMFDYPPELIAVGRPIEDVVRHNAGRGLLGERDAGEAVTRRIEHMRAGHAYTHQRELPDGSVIEIRGNPMPGGGFVTSYSDVTVYKRAERELTEVNETLEDRVETRTQELTLINAQLVEAKAAAERANAAKTRFLAAASHDLAQPLNAARLFASSLDRSALPAAAQTVADQIERSLSAAENMLAGLLDISRLDAHAQDVRREHFPLSELLDPLAAEFSVLAARRCLRLRYRRSDALVDSDPRLLRRVLQNLLSNAVRYTERGSVLIGVRRAGAALRIEVWDSGRGIPEHQQRMVFEEFRRLDAQDAEGARGMGLGLAISERIARMLGHGLTLRSWPGRGTVFSLIVPRGVAARRRQPVRSRATLPGELGGHRVLCLDNEPEVLEGMHSLLRGWGCDVLCARDAAQAEQLARTEAAPDLLLVDYHLDEADNGVKIAQGLRAAWGREIPGIVITADHTQAARDEARRHGYTVLPKPVKPAALRALMTRLLQLDAET